MASPVVTVFVNLCILVYVLPNIHDMLMICFSIFITLNVGRKNLNLRERQKLIELTPS